jgi:hypothetical protein
MKSGSDRMILTTGIAAWLMLAFATVKLSVLYAENPKIAYVITYNIVAVIYLLYFIGYFKERFGLKYLALLLVLYNVGFHSLQWFYNKLFLISEPAFDYMRLIALCVINVPLMIAAWAVLFLFFNRRK